MKVGVEKSCWNAQIGEDGKIPIETKECNHFNQDEANDGREKPQRLISVKEVCETATRVLKNVGPNSLFPCKTVNNLPTNNLSEPCEGQMGMTGLPGDIP